MRKFLQVLGILLAAFGFVYLELPQENPAVTLMYSVRVEVKDGTGSGTVVGKKGQYTEILTCAHVVGDFKTATVNYQGMDFPGFVHDVNVKTDLAYISVQADLPVAPVYKGFPVPGEKVLHVGAPMGELVTITEGYASGLTKNHIQDSAATYPGDSGGGVWIYRSGWVLVGVVEETEIIEEDGFAPYMAPQIAYSIPIGFAKL